MKRIAYLLSTVSILLIGHFAIAQQGNLYVKNYPNSQLYGENSAIIQAQDGIMCFANTKGMLTYDGVDWHIEEITGTAYAFAIDSSAKDRIYVSGKDYFGYLKKRSTGRYAFHSLSESFKSIGVLSSITIIGNEVYFYGNRKIYLYDTKQNKVTAILKVPDKKLFTGWFVHKGRVIVNVEGIGLYEVVEGELRALPNTEGFANLTIQTYFDFNKDQTMLGTSDNQLYLFNETSFVRYQTTAQRYINEFVVRQGLSISDNEMVLSTASGGCVIINKFNGIASRVISTQTGLADDEILAIGQDNQKGLWVCHKSGTSRVALDLPVSAYSTYSGLEGQISNVIRMGYQLFVGTNKGIYYLTQHNWYREVSMQDKKTAYALRSTPFYFKRIANIDAKCKQLINYKGKMIAATNTGLYEVSLTTRRAGSILGNNFISAVHGVAHRNMLYLATENGLMAIREEVGYWSKADTLRMFREEITSIVEKDGYLWLGGITQVSRIKLKKDGTFGSYRTYQLKSSHAEHVQATLYNNEPIFLTSKGAFKYFDFMGGMLLPDKTLSEYFYTDNLIIANQPAHIWMLYQNKWTNIHPQKRELNENRFAYISLFKNVQDIHEDVENNIWVVGNNEVFKIERGAGLTDIDENEAFVRTVKSEDGVFFPLNNLALDQGGEARNFIFHITLPFYLAENNIQYQYRLSGLDDSEWTPWRSKALIEFPFLPSGRYELQIRARNALGQQSDTHYFPFKVKPPFWETWWFYTIEILFMLSLLVASVLFNRRHKQSRIASIITLVSIITIFEFFVLILEPYVDSFSGGVPVFKLIMNILLAYNLLPLERRVRRFIEDNKYIDRWTERFSGDSETTESTDAASIPRAYQDIKSKLTNWRN